jgi:hypothetical protein
VDTDADQIEVVRFYRTTKYPRMLGRLPDGSRIWGGPYTFTQGIIGGSVLLLVLYTWGSWAVYGLLTNIIIAIGAVSVSLYLSGLIRTKNRNPILAGMGAFTALTAPSAGKLDKSFRFRKPRHIRGTYLTPIVATALTSDQVPAYQPESSQTPGSDFTPASISEPALEAHHAVSHAQPSSRSRSQVARSRTSFHIAQELPTPAAEGTYRLPVTAIERLLAQSTPR